MKPKTRQSLIDDYYTLSDDMKLQIQEAMKCYNDPITKKYIAILILTWWINLFDSPSKKLRELKQLDNLFMEIDWIDFERDILHKTN